MRTLLKNQKPIYYALVDAVTAIMDEYGNETGEYEVKYSSAQNILCNVSAATGANTGELFGLDVRYDRVLMPEKLPDGFDETSVLWIETSDTSRPHNYRVTRIASILNGVAIAVSRVKANA